MIDRSRCFLATLLPDVISANQEYGFDALNKLFFPYSGMDLFSTQRTFEIALLPTCFRRLNLFNGRRLAAFLIFS